METLHEYALKKVFSYLNKTDLESISGVCRKFSQILNFSTFEFKLNDENNKNLQIKNYLLNNVNLKNIQIIEVIVTLKEEIKFLITVRKFLKNIFQYSLNLKNFTICIENKNNNILLNKLNFYDGFLKFLKNFKNKKITKVEIYFVSSNDNNNYSKHNMYCKKKNKIILKMCIENFFKNIELCFTVNDDTSFNNNNNNDEEKFFNILNFLFKKKNLKYSLQKLYFYSNFCFSKRDVFLKILKILNVCYCGSLSSSNLKKHLYFESQICIYFKKKKKY